MDDRNDKCQHMGQSLPPLNDSITSQYHILSTLFVFTCALQCVHYPIHILSGIRFAYITNRYFTRSFKSALTKKENKHLRSSYWLVLVFSNFCLSQHTMNTLDAGCKEAYVLTNKNKVYMQATINECGIIHCDRIMN